MLLIPLHSVVAEQTFEVPFEAVISMLKGWVYLLVVYADCVYGQ